MKAKVRHLAADPVVSMRHSPKRIGHVVRQALTLSLAALLVFLVSGSAFAYQQLYGNVGKVAGAEDLMRNRPKRVGAAPAPGDPFTGRALNIVLIGSDSRAGANTKVAKFVAGMRSDTTILAHISKDRSRVDLVSFPRDLMIQIDACQRSDGTSTGAGLIQFNAAFAYGGQNGDVASAAACTMTAVEGVTNVRVDGFIVVDMEGFASVIQAIGGVNLCIPRDIDSPKARLKMSAGFQHLDGMTALKYSRARTGKGLGDGSDLNRIQRQQKLLGAVSAKIMSSAVLTSPPKLLSLFNAVTKSLTMTSEFANIPALVGLGASMSHLSKKNIAFITVPYQAYPADTNRVQVNAVKAEPLFDALRNDQPIEGTHAWQEAKAAGSLPPASTPSASADAGIGEQAGGATDQGATDQGATDQGATNQGATDQDAKDAPDSATGGNAQGSGGSAAGPTSQPSSSSTPAAESDAGTAQVEATESNPFAAKGADTDEDSCQAYLAGQGATGQDATGQ